MASALTPNDYDIIVGTANALRQSGDNRQAEAFYRKAVALRPQVNFPNPFSFIFIGSG